MPKAAPTDSTDTDTADDEAYALPVVHVRIPRTLVNVGFWGSLAAAAVAGVIEAPVAIAIGAAVVVARHATSGSHETNESPASRSTRVRTR